MNLDQRTQQILAERIGMLVIGSARLQAEREQLADALAHPKAPPPETPRDTA